MKPFHLKQFSIQQDKCAMKVTLDACLFGALCAEHYQSEPLNMPTSVLDIGTGTGLLSLMLAQTGMNNITAIELDEGAATQAHENFESSIFSHQLRLIQTDIKDFNPNLKYDLIVSNPPFFSDSLKGPNQQRNQARHNDGLSFMMLAKSIKRLLNDEGEAWVILPCIELAQFIMAAKECQLGLTSKTWIKSAEGKDPHRIVFTLAHAATKPAADFKSAPKTPKNNENTIIINHSHPAEYSSEFQKLLKDYYLKL